ncbi:MAG: oligosaccharide flippase family protein [Candidatus Omnitrophica bacterium]|nr:oligosaccharide flippase family protein [Candidatus Omnitrophota bacterium]
MSNLLIPLRGMLSSGLFKRTCVYTFSISFSALAAFLLLPILTRYLSLYDYGVVETFMSIVACLTGVVMVGGNTLLSKEYFNYSHIKIRNYTGDILGMTLLCSTVVFIIALIIAGFSGFFPEFIKISNFLMLLAIVVAFANAIISMLTTLFQLQKKSISYAIFLNSKTIMEIVVSLFLIIVVGLKWQGRIVGISAASLVFLVIAILIFRNHKVSFKFPTHHGRQIILLGLPLILVHASGWANEMIDKLMINNLINVASTGLYSVGYKFGMVVMMVETAFSRAWLPFFYETVSKNNKSDDLRIVRVTYMYIAGLIVFAIFFGLLGKYLLYFMVDKKFFAAGQFIFLVSMAYCFDGIWKMFIGYLIYKGKTRTYLYIILISAIVNITLNYILLQRIGLIGAAWATFISFGVGAVLTTIAGCRSHPMPWFSVAVFQL